MKKILRILMLEDNPLDAELAEQELLRGGISFSLKRVETKEDFLKNLDVFHPDLILSDYSIPRFDGLSAIEIAKERLPDVPFIILTGAMGDEWAIETLKKGATDYILKQRLPRLVPAVKRALAEALERSEHKRIGKALRESEKRFRMLVERMNEGLGVQDGNGIITYVNRRMCEMLGYSSGEMIGHNVEEFTDTGDREILRNQLKKRKTDCCDSYELTWMRKDGGKVLTIVSPQPILDEENRFAGSFAVITDITDRKRMEDELKMSEIFYRTLFDNTGAITVVIEEDMTISMINMNGEQFLGYPKAEVEGKKQWTDFVDPKEIEKLKEYHRLRRIDQASAPRTYESRLIDQHGKPKDVLITAALIPGTKKSIVSLLDISRQKKTEAELKKRVKELEDFYNIAVGRELRMIELKKEIELLQVKLGKSQIPSEAGASGL
jgi:PAS domain S-box-containing protein